MVASKELRPTSTYPAIVGKVIAMHRNASGLNQSQVANSLGMRQSAWSKIERGVTPPTVEQIAQLSEIINVRPGRILQEADRVVALMKERGIEVLPWRAESEGALSKGWVLIGAIALGGLVAAALASRHGDEGDERR